MSLQSIINPRTGRAVRVGSPTYIKLVKEGLVDDLRVVDKSTKVLYSIEEDDTDTAIESKIDEINDTLPPNQQAVRGRGKYKGSLVKRQKQISTEDAIRHTVKAAAKQLDNQEVYDALKETDNFEKSLERLIMKDLGLMSFQKAKENESDNNREYYMSDLEENDEVIEYEEEEEYLLSSDSDLDLYCDEEFNWDDEPETARTTECDEDIDED
jgi:hypothetical protein